MNKSGNNRETKIETGGGSIYQSIFNGDNNHIINTSAGDSQSIKEIEQVSKELDNLLTQAQQETDEGTKPSNIEAGAVVFRKIKQNESLQSRVLKAIRAGGIEALEKCLEHPAAIFLIAALKEFVSNK